MSMESSNKKMCKLLQGDKKYRPFVEKKKKK